MSLLRLSCLARTANASRCSTLLAFRTPCQNNKFRVISSYSRVLLQEVKAVVKSSTAAVSQQKPKIKTSELRKLLSLAKPEKWNLGGGIALLFLSSAITMIIPFALGKVIDTIYSTNHESMIENLNKVTLTLVGIFVVGALCNFGRTYLMQMSGQRITQTLRNSVFSSIIRREMAFFDRNKTGELVNRLSADTALVSQCITSNIADGLRSTTLVVAGVSMMVYMSPQLALVGLSIVPPVAGIAIAYGRYVRNISKNVQDSLAQATQVAEERLANIRTVRAFGQELREFKRYDDKTQHILQLAQKEAFAKGTFFAITGLSGNAIILSVLYYGGVMVTESAMTAGQLSAFLLYAAYVAISLSGITSCFSETMKGLGASTRLWQLIDQHPTIPVSGGAIVPESELRGNISFKSVTFAYPTRRELNIFSKLDLQVPAGSILAVVGASGSGKSTLASLILRFYDPDQGEILLDGRRIQDLDPKWLRSNIGTVSQDPALFSCSIKENLLYGLNDSSQVTESQLIQAATEANAVSFIRQCPQGFDTVVGERGVLLSGGQRQRLAIARALLKNPRILLLDEATSALDAESESLVQEALEKLMKGRTVLTIAHRLSTIRNADEIAVMNEGRIAERGTYEQLMKNPDGIFRRLVERQTIALS